MVYRPLSVATHGSLRWVPAQDFRFAASLLTVEATVSELAAAALHFPIFFTKGSDQSDFRLVFVVGLSDQENLFVNFSGQWVVPHIPLVLRTWPFSIKRLDGQQGYVVVADEACVPAESAMDNALPFFDDSGALSVEARRVVEFCQQVERLRLVTTALTAELATAGLLQEWPLVVELDSRPTHIDGLWHVSEQALDRLDSEVFLKLRASGALKLAFCQMISIQNMQKILAMHQQRKAQRARDIQIWSMPTTEATALVLFSSSDGETVESASLSASKDSEKE